MYTHANARTRAHIRTQTNKQTHTHTHAHILIHTRFETLQNTIMLSSIFAISSVIRWK